MHDLVFVALDLPLSDPQNILFGVRSRHDVRIDNVLLLLVVLELGQELFESVECDVVV